MSHSRRFALAAILVLATLGKFACRNQPPKVTSTTRFDAIAFKLINNTTKLAELPELRHTHVDDGDIEVRVWRGFGLGDFEGVVLRRTKGTWTGLHVIASDFVDGYDNPTNVEVLKLDPPRSGWDSFWSELERIGIFDQSLTAETECDTACVDGVGDLVEINQDQTYRNYLHSECGVERCAENRRIEQIAQTIGIEFDSGEKKCEKAEWFPCAALLRSYDQ